MLTTMKVTFYKRLRNTCMRRTQSMMKRDETRSWLRLKYTAVPWEYK